MDGLEPCRVSRTKRRLAAAVAAIVLASINTRAQDWREQPPSADSIAAIIGTDADVRGALGPVFEYVLRRFGNGRVHLLRSQVQPEWLPHDWRVELLSDDDAARLLAACGDYWTIGEVQRSGALLVLHLAERCGGTTISYVVWFHGTGWQLGPPPAGWSGRNLLAPRHSQWVRRRPDDRMSVSQLTAVNPAPVIRRGFLHG